MSAPGGTGDKDSTRRSIRQYARRFAAAFRGGKPNGTAANGSLQNEEVPQVRATRTPSLDLPPDAPKATSPDTPLVLEMGARMVPFHVEEDRAARQAEKMKALFFKYDMAFEEGSWQSQSSNPGIRVEKRVRMRVQVRCHACQYVYSSSTGCPQCHHPRCDQCVRHPARRKVQDSDDMDEEAEESCRRSVRRRRLSTATDGSGTFVEVGQDAASSLSPIDEPKKPRKRKDKLLINTSSSGRSSSRVQPPEIENLQCCACQRMFGRKRPTCPRCNHRRCSECSQHASGAAEDTCDCQKSTVDPGSDSNGLQTPSQKCKSAHVNVRWTCHRCHTSSSEGDGKCSCGHSGCERCLRLPPKRDRNRVYLHPRSSRTAESLNRQPLEESSEVGSGPEDSGSASGGRLPSAGVP